MKYLNLKILLLLIITSQLGCTTTYHKGGDGGTGYTEEYLGEDRYVVQFDVNSYTSTALARKYVLRRASELCKSKGLESFKQENFVAFSSNGRAVVEIACVNDELTELSKKCINEYDVGSCYKMGATELSQGRFIDAETPH